MKHSIYKTREECEEKLKVLIAEMKREIAEIKANAKKRADPFRHSRNMRSALIR